MRPLTSFSVILNPEVVFVRFLAFKWCQSSRYRLIARSFNFAVTNWFHLYRISANLKGYSADKHYIHRANTDSNSFMYKLRERNKRFNRIKGIGLPTYFDTNIHFIPRCCHFYAET